MKCCIVPNGIRFNSRYLISKACVCDKFVNIYIPKNSLLIMGIQMFDSLKGSLN